MRKIRWCPEMMQTSIMLVDKEDCLSSDCEQHYHQFVSASHLKVKYWSHVCRSYLNSVNPIYYKRLVGWWGWLWFVVLEVVNLLFTTQTLYLLPAFTLTRFWEKRSVQLWWKCVLVPKPTFTIHRCEQESVAWLQCVTDRTAAASFRPAHSCTCCMLPPRPPPPPPRPVAPSVPAVCWCVVLLSASFFWMQYNRNTLMDSSKKNPTFTNLFSTKVISFCTIEWDDLEFSSI